MSTARLSTARLSNAQLSNHGEFQFVIRPQLHLVTSRSESLERKRPSAAVIRRRRAMAVVIAMLAFTLILCGVGVFVSLGDLFGGGPLAASGQVSSQERILQPVASVPHGEITVYDGDTIWSIARRIHPNGDVRPVVDSLVRRHGSSRLQVGERLTY